MLGPSAHRTTAAPLLAALVAVQVLSCAASRAPALDEERLDDTAAFLQQQARVDAATNSFMREVDEIDQAKALQIFRMIKQISKNTSIPRDDKTMAMLQEAGKVFGEDLGPWEDYKKWWNTEPRNYRSSSVSPQMFIRNMFGPGRKSQKRSCKITEWILLPIAIGEAIMGIGNALSCEETEETALVCQAEPIYIFKTILYFLAYTSYATSWCSPTYKVKYLCGGSSMEVLSRMNAITQSTMKMAGMCSDQYTYMVEGGEKTFRCAFNSVRVAGFLAVALKHVSSYMGKKKSTFFLEHSITATLFDMTSSFTWVAHLLVLVVRDCGNVEIKKSDCGTRAGEVMANILAYGAAETRRRDYCLDKLNKRGARVNMPAGTNALKDLDEFGRVKKEEVETPDWLKNLNEDDDDEDDDGVSVTDTELSSIDDDPSVQYDPSHELVVSRRPRSGSPLGFSDIYDFRNMDGSQSDDEDFLTANTEPLSPSEDSQEQDPRLQGFKVFNNPLFRNSLPPIDGAPKSGPALRQTITDEEADEAVKVFTSPARPPPPASPPLRQVMTDEETDDVKNTFNPPPRRSWFPRPNRIVPINSASATDDSE